MQRRILHIDMDAFFASVEQVRDPRLAGKPLIVGGAPEDRRGVVSTASYEARKYGVHSAMSLTEAHRLCPHGIFIRGNFEFYREASKKVHAILGRVSPLVQMASIDEAYVEVSGSQRLFGGDDGIAAFIKSEVFRQTSLPCTVAIAPNKLVAKVGSDAAKPDGYVRVAEGSEALFLAPLPIAKLPGAGPKTCEALELLGVRTIGDLAALPISRLLAAFGPMGYALRRTAQGVSTSAVETEHIPKSIGRETTFPKDLLDWKHIERVLHYLAEKSLYALREEGMEAQRVTLKVRYADFSTYTFARTLEQPTALDSDVFAALHELLPRGRERPMRVRLIGVSLSQFTHNQHQLPLFCGQLTAKWERVLESVDRVRGKHGFECLRSCQSMALGRDVKLATPALSR